VIYGCWTLPRERETARKELQNSWKSTPTPYERKWMSWEFPSGKNVAEAGFYYA
jgi:hypothetical protein